MSGTNFFRLIEAYFDGTISSAERAMLESQMQRDPLLKAEYDLQKNINSGIKDFRANQLKARLNQIDIPSTPPVWQVHTGKWLAATIISATIIGASFYFLSGSSNLIIPVEINDATSPYFNEEQIALAVPEARLEAAIEEEVESNEVPVESQKESTALYTSEVEKVNNEPNKKSAVINTQSLLSFDDEHLFNEENNLEKVAPLKNSLNKKISTQIEVKAEVERNEFHYQYFENKLYLHGDFSKEPYELIELNSRGKKDLFLSYRDTIYRIEHNKQALTKMEKVKNNSLIEEIKILLSSN